MCCHDEMHMQEEVLQWGPAMLTQNGSQPLIYVVVLLMCQLLT